MREFFWKAPEFASTGDRRMVVEVHRQRITTCLAFVGNRYHLSTFGVIAEPGRIAHPDKLVMHQRLAHFERLGYRGAQQVRVGAVGNDHEFAADETIGTHRKRRASQRHGKCGGPYFVDIHFLSFAG